MIIDQPIIEVSQRGFKPGHSISEVAKSLKSCFAHDLPGCGQNKIGHYSHPSDSKRANLQGVHNNLLLPVLLSDIGLLDKLLENESYHVLFCIVGTPHRRVHADVHGHFPERLTTEN
jgi:hypothetical protein